MSMPSGNLGVPQVEDPDAVRAEWLGRLHALAAQVKGWVEPAGWRTRLVSKPTRDSELGRFDVPLLLMERDGVELALNPVSRFVGESEGAVDLYLVPAYDQVAGIVLNDGEWAIHYVFRSEGESGPGEVVSMALSASNLDRVMGAMSSHAE